MSDTDTLSDDKLDVLDGSLDRLSEVTLASRRFGTAIGAAFKAGTVEGKSFDQLLATLGQRLVSISSDVAFRMVGNDVMSGLRTLTSGLFGGASTSGLASSASLDLSGAAGGTLTAFAKGGIVDAPALFAMSGGTGLVGEAGAEAIVPLARGPDGRLGVRSEKEIAAPVSIVLNVTTPDAASFRQSESYLSGVLARAVARGRRTE